MHLKLFPVVQRFDIRASRWKWNRIRLRGHRSNYLRGLQDLTPLHGSNERSSNLTFKELLLNI